MIGRLPRCVTSALLGVFPCVPGASVLTALMLKRDLFHLIFRKERDTQGLT